MCRPSPDETDTFYSDILLTRSTQGRPRVRDGRQERPNGAQVPVFVIDEK